MRPEGRSSWRAWAEEASPARSFTDEFKAEIVEERELRRLVQVLVPSLPATPASTRPRLPNSQQEWEESAATKIKIRTASLR